LTYGTIYAIIEVQGIIFIPTKKLAGKEKNHE
jgi:hypothetical protein